MFTKSQANIVSDKVIAQQKAVEIESKNANARRVPFQYRCAEINRLQPWMRAAVVHEASRAVGRNWIVRMGFLGWSVTWAAIWYFFVPEPTRNAQLVTLVLVVFFPQRVLYSSLVRLEIRRIARQLASSSN